MREAELEYEWVAELAADPSDGAAIDQQVRAFHNFLDDGHRRALPGQEGGDTPKAGPKTSDRHLLGADDEEAMRRHIGKESNRLEEAQAGLLDDTDEPLNRYDQHDLIVFRELAIPILRHLGVRETARRTNLGFGSVSATLSGRSVPRHNAIARYLVVAAHHAGGLLVARVWSCHRSGGNP